ncbi:hypothetical protein F53441_10544 [Fusarium austroafricanum]|uniref:EKC/KEOPS complex subunit BUD32 n=1 Tax=Fusarium austroafricanum TaxID=2364996 RepID=A0A8H4K6V8_9HYPO|nr:hypothetical protein F53441_10544 [Fusarium austroafricanum]
MSSLDIIKRNEQFKRDRAKISFHRIKFVVEQDKKYYVGYLSDRKAELENLSQLEDCQEIITTNQGPEPLDHWTIAKPTGSHYIKNPKIEDYLDPTLEVRMAREIEVWETIRQNPHAGLAAYYGCVLEGGRVSGLCFARYDQTLTERVNPGRLSKKSFVESDRSLVRDYMKQWLQTIEQGLQHLHASGFCHNDLTPANIMLMDNRAVLIDMDSACRIGESLKDAKRTYGWTDANVQYATTGNDFRALQEIETWLFGSLNKLLLN